MTEHKLNLGSGEFKKTGYINLDSIAERQPDIIHDLENFPYPFPNNYFSHIEADHVLEHLRSPFAVMKELYRILKPGGTLTIRVPHFSRGFSHADHKCGFDVTFPFYFQPNFKGGYSGTPFILKSMKLSWFAQAYLKKDILPASTFLVMTLTGRFINFFANLAPFVASRIWCFWVGGFEQIEFNFRKHL